jgi:inosose dehydratase
MADQKRMLLGIEPTCWSNDDFPELGDHIPYQLILEQTHQAGFEGGTTGHNYPTHLPSLLRAMASQQLKICSTWFGTTFSTGVDIDASLAAFTTQVEFLKEVGAKDVVVAELANAVNQVKTKAVLTERPVMNEAQWFLVCHLLDEAGRIARENGMALSYHPHVGTVIQTLEETKRLLESTKSENVGLCLDTGHLRFAGASQSDLEELFNKSVDRIRHVHLKNVRREVLPQAVNKKVSFYQAILAGIFTVPGDPEGDIDFRPFLQTLQKAGYERWLVVEAEQNPDKADPLMYAQIARTYLRSELGY